MKWKEFLTDYLTFTKKERIGLLVLMIIIVVIWLLPKIVLPNGSTPALTDTSWIALAKKLEKKGEDLPNDSKRNDENMEQFVYDKPGSKRPEQKNDLFFFDPNTITKEEWEKLGVRDKTISTIRNYLDKGGHFNKPGDIQKIYGFHPNEYEKLEPFIKITINHKEFNKDVPENKFRKESPFSTTPKYGVIDINTADTTAFISLPGIGSKLAFRIVNFREKLGGFYSIEQIREIYGLPDSTFQKIKQNLIYKNADIKKININSASKEEMKTHPYIKWSLANAIVEYRNQHGNYSSLEDLKKISVITEEVFDKIKFYLTL